MKRPTYDHVDIEDGRLHAVCPSCKEPFLRPWDDDEWEFPPLTEMLDNETVIECANCTFEMRITIRVTDRGNLP